MTPLKPLRDSQARAADPAVNAWTSASAGTGKTQVLTARVLRLLLQGAAPERILGLTFTKAGATEMQTRIFGQLARWVQIDNAALDDDLLAIHAPVGPETRARARQLFARTLDARGGLRIQTLHSFAQSLLASFPIEAGITPGFAALDDRSAVSLRTRVLAEQIEAASAAGDTGFADDLGALSIASGEARLAQIAGVMIGHAQAIAGLGAPAGFEAKLRRKLEVPVDGSAEQVMAAALQRLDGSRLQRFAKALGSDGGVTSGRRADDLATWLGFDLPARVTNLDLLAGVLFTKAGEPMKGPVPAGALKRDTSLAALADDLTTAIAACLDLRRRLDAAALAARHLRVGARLADAYAAHKLRAGVIDYNDMIARAAALLVTPGMGAWVRFKLDQRLDHLLVDEAQDTNVAQWDIIGALTDEFFDGLGGRDAARTLFVVGDFKQAIMRFQGADPQVFQDRRDYFREKAQSADQRWDEAPLSESFRSVPTVLEVVDAVLDELGFAALGMNEAIPPHAAARKFLPGAVTLWPPLESPAEGSDESPESETPWLPDNHVRMAQQVARQIATWLDPATPLHLPARGRNARPEDILVLVRARGEFMAPLVGALHDAGVAVAGVDRLRLTKPLAVQDLLALVRFALQPGDDLTCATLLTSPFLGWTQDQLLALAAGRGQASLWSRLGHGADAHARTAARWLGDVLALADYGAPYEFLETVLSGPLGGRRRLLARLGDDARDAIGAVLGQALAFEQANAPSLQGFLAWIEADDSDLKRDPDAAGDAVRIMTVHGAKGLQAPVVILADATRDLPAEMAGHVMLGLDGGDPVPVFHGGKAGRLGAIAEIADAADIARMQEHWRLMYVAMTRAEDMLFIGGALPKARGKSPATTPENSWYAVIERAMTSNWALEPEADAVWGSRRTHRGGNGDPVAEAARAAPERFAGALPAWAITPAAAEARPPRPLSPSALAEDDVSQPPPAPAAVAAARRGKLLHALFERLPDVAPSTRRGAALAWLERNGAGLDASVRTALVDIALAVIEAPHFAALFGPDALAEAPIAAVVGEVVIAGKVDRLLIAEHCIQIIDFKTGSRVPRDAASVERYHLRQMAAYAAALGRIFPDRRIEAALLFTHDATLIELPAELLAAHAPTQGG